jgi:F-type H+-transporting ATPase subunit gamma
MAGTREIRRRIKSVKNIGQITKAMELVAASKMRRAQEAALNGRRYNVALYSMLRNLLAHSDPEQHPLLSQVAPGDTRPILVVAFGPDKGLCGGLISNLLREVVHFKQAHPKVEFATMGKRIRDGVRKTGAEIVADAPLHERPGLGDVLALTKIVLDDYESGKYQQVVIANTQFISTLQQKPQIRQLLPLALEAVSQAQQLYDFEQPVAQEFLYEPSANAVLAQLLPRYVEMAVFQALLEAQASEQSARMIAMKNAGDNAHDIQEDLTLAANQIRQASITAELAEISAAGS